MKSLIRVRTRAIGIDIADHTLSLVELEKKASRIVIAGFVQTRIPPGIVVGGRIRDEEKLSEIFGHALSKIRPRRKGSDIGVFGLPERQVYVHVFHTPAIVEREIAKAVEKEAAETFPLEHGDMILASSVVRQDSNESSVVLLAIHRDVLREWHLFFTRMGVSVPVYDSEILAIYRGLKADITKGPIALVDIGAVTNTVSIFDSHGMIRYIYSFEGAGDALTDEVAKTSHISIEEAEKLKRSLDIQNPTTDMGSLLPSFFDRVREEIRNGIAFFETKTQHKVLRIVCVGGTSNIGGLMPYLHESLGRDALIGESGVLNGSEAQKGQGIEAIGLALHLIQKNHIRKDPFFKNPTEQELQTATRTVERKNSGGAASATLQRPEKFQDIQKEKKTLRQQIAILFLILVFGGVAIGGAFWYQEQLQKKNDERIRALTPQYTSTQSVRISVTLRIPSRIFRYPIPSLPIQDSMYAEAIQSLRRQLNDNEDYWRVPINSLIEPATTPVASLVYLIFDKSALREYVKKLIDNGNSAGIAYDIGAIEYLSVSQNTKENLFVLEILVQISSQAPIMLSPQDIRN
ncbi:pilus assembly protein PilM [Candidatus Uhrbacteria bacterium]|nr:pilus assembly protein PilM [Candidatus Uhrbacteria bacterium]